MQDGLLLRTARYYHTLRHLRPGQIVGRVVAAARRHAGLVRLPPVPDGLRGGLKPRVPSLHHDPWNTPEALAAGRFTFLGVPHLIGTPVDWRAADALPLLWRFNLHYFHYLHLLPPEAQAALCRAWIAANPPGTPVAWHPYPTALRIVSWCRAGLGDSEVDRSLYRQAAWLLRTLETYLPGNHLLENARALVLAGRYFDGVGEASRWLRTGLSLYRRETPTQVLSDGGYFERSPMYHALVLEGYLDLLDVLPDGHADRPWLAATAACMADALASVLHPDGTFPLFNDATHEIAPPPAALLARARALLGRAAAPHDALPDTGLYVVRAPGVFVVADAGPMGPDYLPAHGHADLFTFEASFGGRPFVTDTGVLEYRAGAARDHDRGTAAHNTVEVDGRSQAECWGSSRVARRSPPRDVAFASDAAGARLTGTFDGYAALIGDGIVHRRTLAFERARGVLRVEDEVTGHGTHEVVSRLHLHPAVTVEGEGPFVLRHGDVRVTLRVTAGDARWTTTRYSPRFSVAEARPCLVVGGRQTLPVRLVYELAYTP